MMQAVIFDLDDTLYDCKTLDREARHRVRDLVCKNLSISEERYEEAFLRGRSETKKILGDIAASHNRMLYFQKTLEYLNCKPLSLSLQMYETYWGTFLTKMELYPGVRDLLDRLHERGILVGICTDLTAHIQHRKLEALGLTDDVDCLVSSEEAGREKPAPEIFALCLEKLKVSPAQICFVGDSYKRDVMGAVAAGMHAVWFHPHPDDEAICGSNVRECMICESAVKVSMIHGCEAKYETVNASHTKEDAIYKNEKADYDIVTNYQELQLLLDAL